MTPSEQIKRAAHNLGFDLCHIIPITPATAAPHADFFATWLELGHAGEMRYLARHQAKRRAPHLLSQPDEPPYRSLIVLGVDYHQFDLAPALRNDPSRGLIASYAWGDDYHEIIRPLLYELDAVVRQWSGRTTHGKCLVDTGPVLERDWAQAAGLGFTGKNCCTIHPQRGSWLFLAVLLVPELLTYDQPPAPINAPPLTPQAVATGLAPTSHYGSWRFPTSAPALATCGQCSRCLDACPTHAFIGPFHLNPKLCISYWTIEARQPIPRELRPLFGNRIFGCDICQEVCPWNQRLPQHTPLLTQLRAQAHRVTPPLLAGFAPENPYWLNQQAFSTHFRRSPIKRARRAGMLRNVCVALGNWAAAETIPALRMALHDADPLPRGHAAWALGRVYAQHGDADALNALQNARAHEDDTWVRQEIQLAISPA
ncbi:MAG: DUF1730 domain-containing protein [Caldilineaceae bacterium]|nr:DUF1730 domain-containing protein [Caldilineaceae bacterium]